MLLGTGTREGLPRPHCGCLACARAVADGVRRGPASALIGGCLLLDREGEPRDGPDAGLDGPIRLASGGPGRLEEGQSRGLRVGGLDVAVRALAAGAPDRIVLDVTGDDGDRLLWAPVTGPLPADTVDALAGAAFRAVVLGVPGYVAGHPHDGGAADPGRSRLTGFAHELARLRAAGAVADGTDVIAVGIDDGVPPLDELAVRLARWRARTVPDRTPLSSGPASPLASAEGRPAVHRRTLVLGGSGSGKSAVAEDLLAAEPAVVYLATGPSGTADQEWADRLADHRARRPAWWGTVETADVLPVLAADGPPVLLDSVGTWLATALDRAGAWADAPGWQDRLDADVERLIGAWRQVARTVVAVSDEVGWGAVPAFASGRRFATALGRLNQRLAAESERVLLVAAGRVLELPAGPAPVFGRAAARGAAG